jgi:hypothetical protein
MSEKTFITGTTYFGDYDFEDIMDSLIEHGSVGFSNRMWEVEEGILTCRSAASRRGLPLHDPKSMAVAEDIFNWCKLTVHRADYNPCPACRFCTGCGIDILGVPEELV